MSQGQRQARRVRRLILIAGIVYSLAALSWLFLPYLNEVLYDDFSMAGLIGTPFAVDVVGYHGVIVFFIGLTLLAQWALLRPARVWTAKLASRGRPLRSAVLAAAFMAMLLSVGFIALVLEIPNWWEPVIEYGGWWDIIGLWGGMILIWAVWAFVFFAYWRRGDRYTQMVRMIRGLIAGSLLEAFVAVPAHILVMRHRECYCQRGTYTTLVFSGVVLLWAFGPGVVLLYMRERYRLVRLFPKCTQCGYDLRGSTEVCSECGKAIPDSAGSLPE